MQPEFERCPNIDHQSKAHPPTSISTALGCPSGIVVVYIESKTTRLCSVSNDDSASTRRLYKLDCKTSMRIYGIDSIRANLVLITCMLYWLEPLNTQVINGVTVQKMKSQIAGSPHKGEMKRRTKSLRRNWRAGLSRSLMPHKPSSARVSKT
jgi:hypothetical protein